LLTGDFGQKTGLALAQRRDGTVIYTPEGVGRPYAEHICRTPVTQPLPTNQHPATLAGFSLKLIFVVCWCSWAAKNGRAKHACTDGPASQRGPRGRWVDPKSRRRSGGFTLGAELAALRVGNPADGGRPLDLVSAGIGPTSALQAYGALMAAAVAAYTGYVTRRINRHISHLKTKKPAIY
jgi:hypothetical protein